MDSMQTKAQFSSDFAWNFLRPLAAIVLWVPIPGILRCECGTMEPSLVDHGPKKAALPLWFIVWGLSGTNPYGRVRIREFFCAHGHGKGSRNLWEECEMLEGL